MTFAEFTEVLPEKEGAKLPSESETLAGTSGVVDSCNNMLEVPNNPAKVTVLDTINEHPAQCQVTGGVVHGVGQVPLVIPESDLSPSSETSRLLAPVSDSQD